MRFTYDPEVDVLMIRLQDLPEGTVVARTRKIDEGVVVDYDQDGNPIQFEILWASERYPREQLFNHDIHTNLLSLSEAAAIGGLSPHTLKLQAQSGRLQARKIGRNWITTEAWLRDYLQSRRYNAKKAGAI